MLGAYHNVPPERMEGNNNSHLIIQPVKQIKQSNILQFLSTRQSHGPIRVRCVSIFVYDFFVL